MMHPHLLNKLKSLSNCFDARKIVAAVFWDRKEIFMVPFMQQGTTVMSEPIVKHYKTCTRHGKLTSYVVFLHDDSVCPYAAART
jgi:hypothetical protein